MEISIITYALLFMRIHKEKLTFPLLLAYQQAVCLKGRVSALKNGVECCTLTAAAVAGLSCAL